MKKFITFILVGFLLSCEKGENLLYPCIDEDCFGYFYIDPEVTPGVYQDENGYWHVPHSGPNYFTIKGYLGEMYPDYVINGVPLIETVFDSDYWVWIDGLTFTTPLYNVLGFFSDNNYQSAIPVDNLTYTIEDMASIHPPLNIVGYQINPDQCLDCPGAKSLLGTYSKYTYEPQQQIFFDSQMVGDTAQVYVRVTWNTDGNPNNIGGDIEIEDAKFNIIFE